MNSTEYRYVRTPDMSLELALLWESVPILSMQVQEKILKSESSIKCVCVCARKAQVQENLLERGMKCASASAKENPRTEHQVCKWKRTSWTVASSMCASAKEDPRM